MLGRHHISISLLTVLPFMIPLIFSGNSNSLSYFLGLLFSVAVGSLMPDADCGGKPKLYYDFKIVYQLMLPIKWFTVWLFNCSKIKAKLKLEYEVDNEHRGIMHSPVGILISSVIITLVFLIVLLIIGQFNFILIVLVLFGLIIGQLLHILEDSFTVSGINWKFPFGDKPLKGSIYTFERDKEEIDIRPRIYQYTLLCITIILAILYAFNYLKINIFLVYLIIIIVLIPTWIIFYKIAEKDNKRWHKNKKELSNKGKIYSEQLKNLTKI